jgi:hypothetical protein
MIPFARRNRYRPFCSGYKFATLSPSNDNQRAIAYLIIPFFGVNEGRHCRMQQMSASSNAQKMELRSAPELKPQNGNHAPSGADNQSPLRMHRYQTLHSLRSS